MTLTSIETIVDRFVEFLGRPETTGDLLHPDVFADFNVPHWRYQMQGADTLVDQLRADSPFGAAVTNRRSGATPTGFVVEVLYVQRDPQGEQTHYRTLWLADVVDGLITEVVLYCTGEWDEKTRIRHAAEAPMIRP
jgi:hypothetical protein